MGSNLKIILFLGTAIALTRLWACGKENATSRNSLTTGIAETPIETPTETQIPDPLYGTWNQRGCSANASGTTSTASSFEISARSLAMVIKSYNDSRCSDLKTVSRTILTYTIPGAAASPAGAMKMDLMPQARMRTYNTSAAVDAANHAAACGITNWVKDQEADVTLSAFCGLTGSTSAPLYTIYLLDSGTLTFGADGNATFSSSESTRPTTLDTNYIFSK